MQRPRQEASAPRKAPGQEQSATLKCTADQLSRHPLTLDHPGARPRDGEGFPGIGNTLSMLGILEDVPSTAKLRA